MYLAGVSVRRVDDITEALWGTRVSQSTVSELNKKKIGIIGLKSARERQEREAADEEAKARANWRGSRWWKGEPV